MKNRNIGLGIFLLVVGIFWVLMNTGVVDWSIVDTLFTLWPVILVVVGINIIFNGKPAVKIVTWLLFIGLLVGYSYFGPAESRNIKQERAESNIAIQKHQETERATLSATLGGMKLSMDSATDNLLDAAIDDPYITHKEDYSNDKKKAEISFNKRHYVKWDNHGTNYNSSIHLNKDVIWDIKTELGAVSGSFDMAGLKVGKLDMDLGAGDLELIFGSRYEKTEVDIDAGASKLDIVLPEDAGVRIKVDGVLSKTSLDSLNWEKDNNYYVSPNYNNAKSRIDMSIDIGVGALNVKVAGKGPTV